MLNFFKKNARANVWTVTIFYISCCTIVVVLFTYCLQSFTKIHWVDSNNNTYIATSTPTEDNSRVLCDQKTESDKLVCYGKLLEDTLKKEDTSTAFNLFIDLNRSDPKVAEVCHSWLHRLGEVDYALYKNGKDVRLLPEASVCSYGYFHGFINALVEDTGSLDKAVAFCNTATEEDGGVIFGLRRNCLHGIGHGVANLLEVRQENWGDIKKNGVCWTKDMRQSVF